MNTNTTSHTFYTLSCLLCHEVFDESQTATTCLSCGGALDVKYNYEYIKSRLNFHDLRNSPLSARKYLSLYPLIDLNLLVTLSEGGTPLRKCEKLAEKLQMQKLYIKNEGANPTGVFKDRGSLVELTKARELGAQAVCVASTGNMAASVSAYAAISGMPCYVFVPEGTPIGKLAQSLIYGARIIQIRGTYADCCVICEETAKKHGFYLAGDYVFRAEGQKSIAYEIIEQLFWKVPDWVIVPVGCGTNMAGIWKGFQEFYELGFVDKMPKMIAVQPDNVPTIVQAFHEKRKTHIRVDKPSTVATAVGIGVPLDDVKALQCLYNSNGYAETASEEQILEAEKDMAALESLFVEPSSALPIACIPKLLQKGIIKSSDTVVCIATGNGLKDPKSATMIMPDPPVLDPDMEAVDRYLQQKLYEIRAVSLFGRENIVWEEMPEKDEIKNIIKHELNIDLESETIDEVLEEIKAFHEKSEKMKKADLEYIVENVLKEFTPKAKVLEVQDFELQVSQHRKPEAKVKVCFKGECIAVTTDGVGPVDAVIKAIRQAIVGKDTLECWLTTYSVEINTKGTDAVVEVSMGVKSKDGTEIIATATSPDVIVASIRAFEKGYNLLAFKSQ